MDRLEFIGSINQGNFVLSQDAIIQFFDHTMAAYNLVGKLNDINVMSTIDSPACMTFNISFYSQDQASRMMDQLVLNNCMDLYGKHFSILPSLNGNTLGIQILQS